MLFGKNKNLTFKKEKLSVSAVDHFVQQYAKKDSGNRRKLYICYAIW